jgi:GTP-binding protein HflX
VGEEAALAEDMLFATLDPTTRRVRLGDGQTVIVSDTVGFIHKLPHQLVEAFQATLEEVTRADVLLEVVDLADGHAAEHRRTVQTVLDELGAGHKPRVVVLNKSDLAFADYPGGGADSVEQTFGSVGRVVPGGVLGRDDRYAVKVSALSGEGVDDLRDAMSTVLAELWVEVDVAVSYSAGELLARVRERGAVEFEYRDEDVHIRGRVPPSLEADLGRAAADWARAQRAREASN